MIQAGDFLKVFALSSTIIYAFKYNLGFSSLKEKSKAYCCHSGFKVYCCHSGFVAIF